MSAEPKEDLQLENKILGCIYGNCIGDAIGLLTEFMTKKEASQVDICNTLVFGRSGGTVCRGLTYTLLGCGFKPSSCHFVSLGKTLNSTAFG